MLRYSTSFFPPFIVLFSFSNSTLVIGNYTFYYDSSQIEDNTEIEKVSTEQERQSFVDKLSEVSSNYGIHRCFSFI